MADCTEVIGPGLRAVLHTKTGPECTYNTNPIPTTAPVKGQIGGISKGPPFIPNGNSGPGGEPLDGKCIHFRRHIGTAPDGQKVWEQVDEYTHQAACEQFCHAELEEKRAKGVFATAPCVLFGNPPDWQLWSGKVRAFSFPLVVLIQCAGDMEVASGTCSCNNAFILEIVQQFVNNALPAIEEVSKHTLSVT